MYRVIIFSLVLCVIAWIGYSIADAAQNIGKSRANAIEKIVNAD